MHSLLKIVATFDYYLDYSWKFGATGGWALVCNPVSICFTDQKQTLTTQNEITQHGTVLVVNSLRSTNIVDWRGNWQVLTGWSAGIINACAQSSGRCRDCRPHCWANPWDGAVRPLGRTQKAREFLSLRSPVLSPALRLPADLPSLASTSSVCSGTTPLPACKRNTVKVVIKQTRWRILFEI